MHREAFLKDIIEHPEDDAPRLIYADWLEDHGDENDRLRAEFIRAQCRLATLPPDSDEALALADRADDLLAEHRKGWEGPLGKLVGRCEFHRGFVSSIDVKYSDFLSQGEEIFALAPIRAVRFLGRFGTSRKIRQIIDCPHFGRLSSADFSEAVAFDPAAAVVLAQSKNASGLMALNLARNRLGSEGIQSLVSSRHLAGLKDLNLRSNNLGTRGINALTSTSSTFRLNNLDLGGMRIYAGDVAVLANAEVLAGLTGLDLSCNEIGLEGLRRLAGSPWLRDLRALKLGRLYSDKTRWGREAAEVIACSETFARLETLSLTQHALGNRGLMALAASPFLQLRCLGVSGNEITEAGLSALVGSVSAARLTSLTLSANQLTPEAMEALAASPHLARLLDLDLHCCPIGDAGVKPLARSPQLGRLRSLMLAATGVGSEGALALAESPHLRNLRRLSLDHNPLTQEALNKLIARFGKRVLGMAGRP
jgi:uncharacterized protein (TIGR02996 family)